MLDHLSSISPCNHAHPTPPPSHKHTHTHWTERKSERASEREASELTWAYCMAFFFSPVEVPLPIQTKSAALVSTMNTSCKNTSQMTFKMHFWNTNTHSYQVYGSRPSSFREHPTGKKSMNCLFLCCMPLWKRGFPWEVVHFVLFCPIVLSVFYFYLFKLIIIILFLLLQAKQLNTLSHTHTQIFTHLSK